MQVIRTAIFQDRITEKFNSNCNLLIWYTSSFDLVQSAGVVFEVNTPGDSNSSFTNFDVCVNISSSAIFHIISAPHMPICLCLSALLSPLINHMKQALPGRKKSQTIDNFFSYFCYEFLKPVWKSTANIPKGLLNLLFCFKVKCSHIKPCKWKPSSGPLNPRISSGTHSVPFPMPICHGAQDSRQPLLKRGSDILLILTGN